MLARLKVAKQVVFFVPIIFRFLRSEPGLQIDVLRQLRILPWIQQQDFRAVLNLLFSLKRFCGIGVERELIETVDHIFRAREFREFQDFQRLAPGCSNIMNTCRTFQQDIEAMVKRFVEECLPDGTVEHQLQGFCHPGLESAADRSVRERPLGDVIIVDVGLRSMAGAPSSFAVGFHIRQRSRERNGNWSTNPEYATEEYAARVYLNFLYHGILAKQALQFADAMFVCGVCCAQQARKQAQVSLSAQTVLCFPGFSEPKTSWSAVLHSTTCNNMLYASFLERKPSQPAVFWNSVAQEAQLKARVDRRRWVHTIQDVEGDLGAELAALGDHSWESGTGV